MTKGLIAMRDFLAALRELLRLLATPFVAGRNGGWTYRLPDYPASAVTDQAVLDAIARGNGTASPEQELPPRQLVDAAPTAKEGH